MPLTGRERGLLTYKHNSFMGSAAMMRKQCLVIQCSSTATAEAKGLAAQIHTLSQQLQEALKKRVPFPQEEN